MTPSPESDTGALTPFPEQVMRVSQPRGSPAARVKCRQGWQSTARWPTPQLSASPQQIAPSAPYARPVKQPVRSIVWLLNWPPVTRDPRHPGRQRRARSRGVARPLPLPRDVLHVAAWLVPRHLHAPSARNRHPLGSTATVRAASRDSAWLRRWRARRRCAAVPIPSSSSTMREESVPPACRLGSLHNYTHKGIVVREEVVA